MATYNGDLFLNQQLDSILKQLSLEDEIIISDNGSTDNTVSIIENYKDTRIKLLHFTEKNLILNFENALNKASGDVIFLSDQDDIWIEGKVQKYKELLKDNLLVFSNASIFQNNNIESSKLFFNSQRKRTGIFNNLIKVNFLGCTLAFQRRVLEKALPFPKNIPMHDIWIGLIAETMGNTFYIEKPLIFYRRHENVASATGSKSSFSLAKKIKIRIDLLVGLIFRSFK
tara:strand:- start:1482 stop:2165 length:684 start_codon:yes stop_codon:yes gene_type:complete